MLTLDIAPTTGTALLGGYDIQKQGRSLRHLIGYCPQFDALLENLTAREQLRLYASIKGVQTSKIDRYVDDLISEIGLTEYADRPCGQYSGGNKRKLSVGLALIGDPPCVLLDEPST
jgi:ABC-type multidrug transport system ATPase subunit